MGPMFLFFSWFEVGMYSVNTNRMKECLWPGCKHS